MAARKLSTESVVAIREAMGTLREIAGRFGTSIPTVSRIRNRPAPANDVESAGARAAGSIEEPDLPEDTRHHGAGALD